LYTPKKIIISRTDSIGDVILTFPIASVLKSLFPKCEILFLGSEYTHDIVNTCAHIDEFEAIDPLLALNVEEQIKIVKSWKADGIIHAFPRHDIAKIAKQAAIKLRIGASGRIYHYRYCNRIVPLTRRRSDLHEAQLNLKLIKSLGANAHYSLDEIKGLFGFKKVNISVDKISALIKNDKFNLILHPKSKGSAREWGLSNFRKLIEILSDEQFEIFITGTAKEGELIKNEMPLFFRGVHDMTGKLSLKELIGFIQAADGLVAASTGPLHVAAISGKTAIGLFPPIRPMHPGRWAPIGEKAVSLVKHIECSDCRGSMQCKCLSDISPEEVKTKLQQMINA